jgi:hypothetical protein
MTTDEKIKEAQLQLIYAEIDSSRRSAYLAVAQLAVSILNDKHASTIRNVEAAVAEAMAVYRAVESALKGSA